MSRRRKGAVAQEISSEEEASLALGFAGAEPEPDSILAAVAGTEEGAKIVGGGEADDRPPMSSPDWQGYVMSQFAEGELDPDGRPMVHGLRRVVRLVLGPIASSTARVVQAPLQLDGAMRPAVVEHAVEIVMMFPGSGLDPMRCTFSDAADLYHANAPDKNFARFPTAMAATRAESRCLRKALQLRGAASEEMGAPALEDGTPDGLISPDQVNFINVLCRRNDISVLALINSGKRKYASIDEVPYETAQQMTEHLSGLQNDSSKIRPELKGYEPNWRSAA